MKENNLYGTYYLLESQEACWRFLIYSIIFAISLLQQYAT